MDRVQCLQRQYNRIKDKKAQIYLNGNKTLDEDIADNAAVKITYKLFMDYLETNKIEIIPGRLNYTNEQTYFIGYAVVSLCLFICFCVYLFMSILAFLCFRV